MDGWIKPIARLQDRQSWEPLFSETYIAETIDDTRYKPIPPVVKTSAHNFLLVGSNNPDAPPSWALGCWLTVMVEINPDPRAGIVGNAEIQRMPIPLNRYKLIWIPQFSPIDVYALAFAFPYWHRQIKIEAFWFNNPLTTDVQMALANIEENLESLQ